MPHSRGGSAATSTTVEGCSLYCRELHAAELDTLASGVQPSCRRNRLTSLRTVARYRKCGHQHVTVTLKVVMKHTEAPL
eukprot:4079621-Pleurochrysis_carterae.AAC.2